MKEDSEFKCQEYEVNSKLNGESLEIVEKIYYLGRAIETKRGAVDSTMTMIKSGWSKFRDLVPLLASKSLPLGAKGRLYSAYVGSVMLYGRGTWAVRGEDVIRPERKDARMVKWITNVRSEGSIFAEELRTRIKLTSMKGYFQDRGL